MAIAIAKKNCLLKRLGRKMNKTKELGRMNRDEILELLRIARMSRRDLADKIGVKENIVQRWLMKVPVRTPSPAASTLMRLWLREARGEIKIIEVEPAAVAG